MAAFKGVFGVLERIMGLVLGLVNSILGLFVYHFACLHLFHRIF